MTNQEQLLYTQAFNVGFFLERNAQNLLKRIKTLAHHKAYADGLTAGQKEAVMERELNKRKEKLKKIQGKSSQKKNKSLER